MLINNLKLFLDKLILKDQAKMMVTLSRDMSISRTQCLIVHHLVLTMKNKNQSSRKYLDQDLTTVPKDKVLR